MFSDRKSNSIHKNIEASNVVTDGTVSSSSSLPLKGTIYTTANHQFTKEIIRPGSGLDRPNEGSKCVLRMTPTNDLGEKIVEYALGCETEIQLGTGEGDISDLVDSCLETMQPGEASLMTVPLETVRRCCSDASCLKSRDGKVELEIELKSLVRDKDIYEMTSGEKIIRAAGLKTKGSRCFGRGCVERAERFYLRALRYLITVDPADLSEEDESVSWQSLKRACLLNAAACQLPKGRYEDVVSHCTKALAIDGGDNNAKGLFRRGVAYMELQEYEKARGDFDHALRLEPRSKALQQQRKILAERVKNLDAKYATAMSKMFSENL